MFKEDQGKEHLFVVVVFEALSLFWHAFWVYIVYKCAVVMLICIGMVCVCVCVLYSLEIFKP